MSIINIFRDPFFQICVPLTLATVLTNSIDVPLHAQETEIEIVNQDGEPVKSIELAPAEKVAPVAGDLPLNTEDGKLVVTDTDGKQRTIDVQGAQSVVVNRGSRIVNENGEQKVVVTGKAVIVDRDGQRHEIDLGENQGGELDLPMMPKGLPGVFSARQAPVNKFLIGVHCQPVSAALRAQLLLDADAGLIVDHVGDGTPASEVGLQPHDILMFADDQQLRTQQDLIDAVQQAGNDESAVSLTVIRGGKEIALDVSPVKRTPEQIQAAKLGGGIFRFGGPNNLFNDVEFKQFGPGIIAGGNADDLFADMQEQMQEVQQQMQQMRERMRDQMLRDAPAE